MIATLLLLSLLTSPHYLVTVRADDGKVIERHEALDRPSRDGERLCFHVERKLRPLESGSTTREVCVPARGATVEEIVSPPRRPFESESSR